MQSRNSLILFLTLFLVACVTQPSPKIVVSLSDNQILDFTGKGAAAGIMLDSVMGGAGIAIGIAIDKGIAKDIAKNLSNHKPLFNIVDNIDQQLKTAITKNHLKHLPNVQIAIEHYGFKTFSSGEDAASAWLEVNLIIDGQKINIRYPENFDHIDSANLASVKENPEVAYRLLNSAVQQLVSNIIVVVKK